MAARRGAISVCGTRIGLAHAIGRATAADVRRTTRFVWIALTFHLAWTCLVGPLSATSSLASPRTFMAGGVFYGKPDIDSAILGVTAALLLRRLLLSPGRGRGWALLGLVAAAYSLSHYEPGRVHLSGSCNRRITRVRISGEWPLSAQAAWDRGPRPGGRGDRPDAPTFNNSWLSAPCNRSTGRFQQCRSSERRRHNRGAAPDVVRGDRLDNE